MASTLGLHSAASGVMRCRRDLRVHGALQLWWELAQGETAGQEGLPSTSIDAQRYMEIFKRVHRALVTEYNEYEAREIVSGDWQDLVDDVPKGRVPGFLGEDEFKQSVFELAVWSSRFALSTALRLATTQPHHERIVSSSSFHTVPKVTPAGRPVDDVGHGH